MYRKVVGVGRKGSGRRLGDLQMCRKALVGVGRNGAGPGLECFQIRLKAFVVVGRNEDRGLGSGT